MRRSVDNDQLGAVLPASLRKWAVAPLCAEDHHWRSLCRLSPQRAADIWGSMSITAGRHAKAIRRNGQIHGNGSFPAPPFWDKIASAFMLY